MVINAMQLYQTGGIRNRFSFSLIFAIANMSSWLYFVGTDVDAVKKKGDVIYLGNNLHKRVFVGPLDMDYFPFGNVCELLQLGLIFLDS